MGHCRPTTREGRHFGWGTTSAIRVLSIEPYELSTNNMRDLSMAEKLCELCSAKVQGGNRLCVDCSQMIARLGRICSELELVADSRVAPRDDEAATERVRLYERALGINIFTVSEFEESAARH